MATIWETQQCTTQESADARGLLFHRNKPTTLSTNPISKRIGKKINEWKQRFSSLLCWKTTHRDLIQLWVSGLTLNDLILAKCVTALMLFKCRVFLSVNISKVLAALDKQMTFHSSSFPSLKQRSWILMSVENYVVMHVSLENINSSHKKVKGSKKVFTVNWKQSVNSVLI